MSKKKKGLSIFLITIICVGAAFVYFSSKSLESKLDRYFKEKYGIEVVLVDEEEWNTGNMGDLTHTVAVRENKNIKFNVFQNDGEITGDTYHRGLDAYEKYKKLEPLLSEIQKLGYGEPPFGNYLEYIREVSGEYNLKFSRDGRLDYHSFEEREFNDFFQLVQIINQSEINVKDLQVYYTEPEKEGENPGDIYFSVEDLNDPKSTAEVKDLLRIGNWDLKNAYISTAYDEAFEKAEKERFRFGAVYEDDWLICRNIYPITGYCSPYEAHVAYPKDEFQPGSALLAEDLERAREILTELLPENSRFEIVLAGVEDVDHPKKNNETIDFKRITIESDDWKKYDSVKSLLKAKFQEVDA